MYLSNFRVELSSGMHPIGQFSVLMTKGSSKIDELNIHAPICIVDATKIDENEGSEVVVHIDKYITCALPDETKYPEMRNLVKIVQIHNHAITCRKKEGVTWRFSATWAPSDQTRTVHFD